MTHTTALHQPYIYTGHSFVSYSDRLIKMQRPIVVAMSVLLCLQSVVSFLPPTPIAARSATAPARRGNVQMNGVTDAIQSYVGIWSPTIRTIAADANIPTALIKWFHGANMGIVLTTMASLGAYLGWKIRNGDGEIEFSGKTARELHPTLMGLAFLFFFLGGQGGLVLLDVQNHPILNSTHAVTGLIGIALLAFQALLPKLFDGDSGETARTAHAYLGSATMALLFIHAGFGLQLGFSF